MNVGIFSIDRELANKKLVFILNWFSVYLLRKVLILILIFFIVGCSSSTPSPSLKKNISISDYDKPIAFAVIDKKTQKLKKVFLSDQKLTNSEEIIRITESGFYPDYNMGKNLEDDVGNCSIFNSTSKYCTSTFTHYPSVLMLPLNVLLAPLMMITREDLEIPKFQKFDKDEFINVVIKNDLEKERERILYNRFSIILVKKIDSSNPQKNDPLNIVKTTLVNENIQKFETKKTLNSIYYSVPTRKKMECRSEKASIKGLQNTIDKAEKERGIVRSMALASLAGYVRGYNQSCAILNCVYANDAYDLLDIYYSNYNHCRNKVLYDNIIVNYLKLNKPYDKVVIDFDDDKEIIYVVKMEDTIYFVKADKEESYLLQLNKIQVDKKIRAEIFKRLPQS